MKSARQRFRRLRAARFTALGLGAAMALAGASAGGAAAASVTMSALGGVTCTSVNNCWAVGYTTSASRASVNETLRWNGKKWTSAAVPSPGGTQKGDYSQLYGVTCVAVADCWAVGYYASGAAYLTEALHWTGGGWTAVSTPDPAGKGNNDFNQLTSVTCLSAKDCWAVGLYSTGAGNSSVEYGLITHWNGRTWSKVKVPNPGGTRHQDTNLLNGVYCLSAKNCLAVGGYGSSAAGGKTLNEVLSWNGTKWSAVAVPDPGGRKANAVNELSSVTCTAARNCLAVGTEGNDHNTTHLFNEVLKWNGRTWSQVGVPNPDHAKGSYGNELSSISCTGASNCWAVGNSGLYAVGTGISNEALHWTGKKWSSVSIPDPAGHKSEDLSILYDVRCQTAKDCWAVGEFALSGSVDQQQLLQWNNEKWNIN